MTEPTTPRDANDVADPEDSTDSSTHVVGRSSDPVERVEFPNGNVASLLTHTRDRSPAEMVGLLGLNHPSPVVVVAGGADTLDPALSTRLRRLFVRGLVPPALAAGAVLVDGGTSSGVMAILGESVADRASPLPLLGVALIAKVAVPGHRSRRDDVPLDPNHTHFVLADGEEWGDETDVLMNLVEELSAGGPVVTILAGGGAGALEEAVQTVRRRWPLIILRGAGGAADALAAAADERGRRVDSSIQDPAVAEVVAGGELDVVAVDGDPVTFSRLVARRVEGDASLRLSWEQFALFDRAAVRHQREFRRTQLLILGLGLLGAALALTQSVVEDRDVLARWAERALRYTLVVIPILMTALFAAGARFKSGSTWVVLRGAAESIKSEIFRYRARAGPYNETHTARIPSQVQLADAVGQLVSTIMQTEVNLTALGPVDGPLPPPNTVHPRDDGFSRLTPDRYLEVRLLDQLQWYRKRTVALDRRLRRLRWIVISIGGVGTLLAAVGLELWIALTTAVVVAVTAYLEYEQVESTLLHYNQAAAGLETIREWWVSLPVEAQSRPSNLDRLVEHAERTMQTEQKGWVQEMHDALADLRLRQTQASSEDRRPGPQP